jgi:hypothetical protein
MVIDVYVDLKRKRKSSAQIKKGMEDKINEITATGQRVSKHVIDWTIWNVFDIAPSCIPESKYDVFTEALRSHPDIYKVIPYPEDPAFHIEIKQPKSR